MADGNVSIVVVPHFDDEVLQTGSFLVAYPGKLRIVFTHPDDKLSETAFEKERETVMGVFKKIGAYRLDKGFEPVTWEIARQNTGLPAKEQRLSILHAVERAIGDYETVDNFVFTLRTGHESHTECSQICLSALRHNYLRTIRNILQATYPGLIYGFSSHSIEDTYHNVFMAMTKQDVGFLSSLLSEDYIGKCWKGSTYEAEGFVTECQFFGRRAGVEAAMPYVARKILL